MAAASTRSIQITTITALFTASAIAVTILYKRQKKKSNKPKQQQQQQQQHDDTNDNELSHYTNLGISPSSLPPHILRNIAKERRRKSKADFLSMKSPMYDNVFMLDPDRNLMCTISLKKAKWYVRKEIAEWINTNTTASNDGKKDDKYIRLLFTPKNNGDSAQNQDQSSSELLYLRTPKRNICVVCGSPGHHMRHYIVPYSYRSLFPHEYKSHMSHDIVIVCTECHVHVDRVTKRRMNRIEGDLREEWSALEKNRDYWCSPVIEDTYLYHVRSCAIALVKWRDGMPMDTVESHEREVREYLMNRRQVDSSSSSIGVIHESVPLTKAQLQSACGINYRIKNPEYVTGSELVVKSLDCDADKIEAFIKEWRQHFIDTVHPRFMPKGWCVNNPVACGRS